MTQVRTALICHHDAPLHGEGITRWLASWSDLVAIVVITEPRTMLRKRLVREFQRVGVLRLLDVLAARLYFRVANAGADQAFVETRLAALRELFPPVSPEVPVLHVTSPNDARCQELLERVSPDVTLALCKNMLASRIFRTARAGTIVLHPGICPEYRNSHGCFWAMARNDLSRVGMTMLRIDEGVDTGPVFGYFTAPYDEVKESHVVIQHRMVLDNLPSIAARLSEVARGDAVPLSTAGRTSRAWGQPWLTAYVRWKRRARARHRA